MRRMNFSNKSGMILILALWSIGLLTVLAVYLGIGARQRITLVKRLEERNRLDLIAKSGIRKGIAVLEKNLDLNNGHLMVQTKKNILNDPKALGNIGLDNGSVNVYYYNLNKSTNILQKTYGMIDEGSKININFADKTVLSRLFRRVLGFEGDKADDLALAIVDWREYGESTLKGFFSDDYYENLEFSYLPKNGKFEVLEELLLVEGVNQVIFDRLRPFITIYGDGKLNVNTASFPALVAIGFSRDVSEKILSVRQGQDEREASLDDRVFSTVENFVSLIGSSSALTDRESLQAEYLSEEGKISVNSNFYTIISTAKLDNSNARMTIRCVYNVRDKKNQAWDEF